MMRDVRVRPHEVVCTAVRSQGAGGQNVNKVSSAAHLRFDVRASSLPDDVKARLLTLADARMTRDGVLVLKAQTHRSLELNRAEALARLQALVDEAARPPPPPRRATAPSWSSRQRRLDGKSRRGAVKALRARPAGW